jgi:hypothetical protein
MNINNFAPGPDLYRHVRAGFITQGSTLTEWCRKKGTSPTNARSALVGAWNGPKGRALRAELIEASGIAHPSEISIAV